MPRKHLKHVNYRPISLLSTVGKILTHWQLVKFQVYRNKLMSRPFIKRAILQLYLTTDQFLYLVRWVRYSRELYINISLIFCQEHHITTTLQSGFVPGDSTVNQLVDIYNTFCKALDDGKEVRAIFCDISKAFDRVWHKGLIYKLKTVGISGSVLLWFTDYLDNRKQRVVLPGACSNWTPVNAGYPQGSILGPLLFLLYISTTLLKIYVLV